MQYCIMKIKYNFNSKQSKRRINPHNDNPAGIYLLKVTNIFIVNFEHISHLVLVFLLLTLNL